MRSSAVQHSAADQQAAAALLSDPPPGPAPPRQPREVLGTSAATLSKLYAEVSELRQDAEAREFIVADLRGQVTELLGHQQEAAGLRRQLQLLDERVRARDLAQQARVDEMAEKIKLHETVESQLEAQMLRLEEERLGMQKRCVRLRYVRAWNTGAHTHTHIHAHTHTHTHTRTRTRAHTHAHTHINMHTCGSPACLLFAIYRLATAAWACCSLVCALW